MSAMDINMITGEPCDPAVADLPLWDPRCYTAVECCIAFYAGENRSQEITPFAEQFRYGHYTTYYWVVIVGLVSLAHGWNLWWDSRRRRQQQRRTPPADSPVRHRRAPSILDKLRAAWRYISYRRLDRKPNAFISLPHAGLLTLVLLSIAYVLALILTEKPYYRPFMMWGSPPIAIRTGLMAFACLPLMVALAGKANIITLLTGYSHERLNVLHQWVAWISFVLSLVHTIPFFVSSYDELGNGGYARVVSEFYRNGGGPMTELSGVPPLAMHFGLCVFSIPSIRKRYYETFYWLHIGMATSYLGLLFWHAGDAEDSWAYLWATLAIWLTAWFVRFFHKMRATNIQRTWFEGQPAVLRLLNGDLIRMEIKTPENFATHPGQHCFIRIPALSLLENHPFTIANAPLQTTGYVMDVEKEGNPSPQNGLVRSDSLLFLAKVHSGFTKTLAEQFSVRKTSVLSASVHLDGPYGGNGRIGTETRYDEILLIAGGSGITACLSWLLYLTSTTLRSRRLKRVTLLWSVRDAASLEWISKELIALQQFRDPALDINLIIHVTGLRTIVSVEENLSSPQPLTPLSSNAQSSDDDINFVKTEKHAIADSVTAINGAPTHYGRADLAATIADAAKSLSLEERLLVIASGTHTMNYEVANAVAVAQKLVLRGRASEIGLEVETFGW